MSYETQILWMEKLAETFDAIGYVGVGRQCLTKCIAAFKAGDETAALWEYRKTIGSAPNFVSALTDLETDKFYKAETMEKSSERSCQMLGVMTVMSFLMGGNAK